MIECPLALVLTGLIGVCLGLAVWGLNELRYKILFDLEDRFDKRYLMLEDGKHERGWTISSGWTTSHLDICQQINRLCSRISELETKKGKK